MPAPDLVKRTKTHLAIAMVFAAVGVVVGPYVLASIGLITQLKPYAWVVLAIAYVGILLKSSISYLTTKEFRYDKSAYDLCVLVFGGILACTALQIVTASDLFPGIENISFLHFASTFGLEPRGQHLALLFLLLIGTLVSTIVAALGVADTESGKPCWWWTLGCSVIAYALLAATHLP